MTTGKRWRWQAANGHETLLVSLGALAAGFAALVWSLRNGAMLMFDDAISHLGIARQLVDYSVPSPTLWGTLWLPLQHLLILSLVWKTEWWQNGLAGALPSLAAYVAAVVGVYRLGRLLMPVGWAIVATVWFGLNPNLLYLSTTAMTEALSLACQVWVVVALSALLDSMEAQRPLRMRLMLLGLVVQAGVMTRFEGWILAAGAWCIVTWQVAHRPALWHAVRASYGVFAALLALGPLLWFAYNHFAWGDWLDFARGPYSSRQVVLRVFPNHYFGWHDPARALLLYCLTAARVAASGQTAIALWIGAAWGSAQAWRAVGTKPRLLLLWLPLPFYVYSIASGSSAISLTDFAPYWKYATRYGLAVLPALTLFSVYAVSRWAVHWEGRWPRQIRLVQPAALLLVVANGAWMMHRGPLVLADAHDQASRRARVVEPLRAQLAAMPPEAPILMFNWGFDGSEEALERAGVPLKRTIGPLDPVRWKRALEAPAASAAYVVAMPGDEISRAIEVHPEHLTELPMQCSPGIVCPQIYRSEIYRLQK